MNDVEDVWWCRTPKNSVVYGSGERRNRGQRRIALHSILLRFRTLSRWITSFTHWRGPLKVVSGKKFRYTLYDLITQKSSIYHVSAMKPFVHDPAITNPLDVTRRDHMEYFVEEILSPCGPHQRSKIEFLVKWLNYPECENSWEPYANLRDVDKLHVYLRQNNLQKLLNKHNR
jgi:Chromo (CHRromatin Organisation MOdifier) domain